MLSTEGNRCCTSSFLMFYFFLSKSWLLLFLNVASLLAKVKLRPVHRHPSYLPHVTGIPRVLDHLLDPEARGFNWRRNCHCALNLAPYPFPSLSFSHVTVIYMALILTPSELFLLWVWGLKAFTLKRQFSVQWLFSHHQCVPPVQNLGPNLLPACKSTQCTSLLWIAWNQLLSVIDYHHS